MRRFLSFLLLLPFAFWACDDNKPVSPTPVKEEFPKGIFVTNEGVFQNGTGSITYFNTQRNEPWQEVFLEVNQRPLGNVVQSMAIHNDKVYIMVNNGGKAEVVHLDDFQSTGTVEGLVLPRMFLGISDTKGYISQWGNGGTKGSVEVVDLQNLKVSKSIATGAGADVMFWHHDQVLVLNSGGFANDSTMTVINPETDAIVQTVQLRANPRGIMADRDGNLWILCGGKYNFMDPTKDSPGHLLRIDPFTFAIDLDLEFPERAKHPDKLVINSSADKLYFLYGGSIYSHKIEQNKLSLEPLVKRSFYGLGYDSSNDYLMATDATDFISRGWVIRYRENGAAVDSFQAGVIPGNFIFNN